MAKEEKSGSISPQANRTSDMQRSSTGYCVKHRNVFWNPKTVYSLPFKQRKKHFSANPNHFSFLAAATQLQQYLLCANCRYFTSFFQFRCYSNRKEVTQLWAMMCV